MKFTQAGVSSDLTKYCLAGKYLGKSSFMGELKMYYFTLVHRGDTKLSLDTQFQLNLSLY